MSQEIGRLLQNKNMPIRAEQMMKLIEAACESYWTIEIMAIWSLFTGDRGSCDKKKRVHTKEKRKNGIGRVE